MNYGDLRLYPSDPQTTEVDLLKFEHEQRLKLPADYRNLLLKYNGGMFFNNERHFNCYFNLCLLIDEKPEPIQITDDITEFFSLDLLFPGTYTALELEQYDDDEEEQIVRTKARTLLGIANGINGQYLIDFGPEKYGQIFFYLNEYFDVEKQPYLVAPSFRAWVEQFVIKERFDFTLGKNM